MFECANTDHETALQHCSTAALQLPPGPPDRGLLSPESRHNYQLSRQIAPLLQYWRRHSGGHWSVTLCLSTFRYTVYILKLPSHISINSDAMQWCFACQVCEGNNNCISKNMLVWPFHSWFLHLIWAKNEPSLSTSFEATCRNYGRWHISIAESPMINSLHTGSRK